MPKAEPQVVVHELDAETHDAINRLMLQIERLEEAIKLFGFIVAEAGGVWLPAGLLQATPTNAVPRIALPRTRKAAPAGPGLFDGPEGQG